MCISIQGENPQIHTALENIKVQFYVLTQIFSF